MRDQGSEEGEAAGGGRTQEVPRLRWLQPRARGQAREVSRGGGQHSGKARAALTCGTRIGDPRAAAPKSWTWAGRMELPLRGAGGGGIRSSVKQ